MVMLDFCALGWAGFVCGFVVSHAGTGFDLRFLGVGRCYLLF